MQIIDLTLQLNFFIMQFVLVQFISFKLFFGIIYICFKLTNLVVQLFLAAYLLLSTLLVLIAQVLQFDRMFFFHIQLNLVLYFLSHFLSYLFFDLFWHRISHLDSCYFSCFLNLKIYHELSQVLLAINLFIYL